MLNDIDPIKSAVAAIFSAAFGTITEHINLSFLGFLTVDDILQRLAWTFAILAAAVSIVNGTKNWVKRKKK